MNTTYMKFNIIYDLKDLLRAISRSLHIIYDLKDLVSEESPLHIHVLLVCTLRACDTDIFLSNECTRYGVATMSRMLKNTGLFAEYRSLL